MQLDNPDVAVIILAAGLGKRMQSDKAKVLHEILGRPMIQYVVETAREVAGRNVIVVVGHQAQEVRRVLSMHADVAFAFQDRQLGTGHAVLCALGAVPAAVERLVILCGDVPMLSAATVRRLLQDHVAGGRDLSLLAVTVENPAGYGRLLVNRDRELVGIVEEADASAEQKKIRTVNAGIYCAEKEFLTDALGRIRPDNKQGELYLTDIIEVAYRNHHTVGALFGGDAEEVIGVNSRADLAAAEKIMRRRQVKIS